MKELLLQIVLPALLAAIVVRMLHPTLVNIAIQKGILDKPGARKLNKNPVPVLGGMGVFMGVLFGVGVFAAATGTAVPFIVFVSAIFMLMVGLVDDIFNMKARNKLIYQIVAVCMIMLLGGYKFDNLHGLWGVWGTQDWFSYALTLVACVGLINAINLIDGVDGLSSGFGIIASVLCGAMFWGTGNVMGTIMAFSTAGALVPFFFFNVFSRKYKMYIGDSGTMFLGVIFSFFCLDLLRTPANPVVPDGMVSFLFAVFAVPVFDTLRVMTARIVKGGSPFTPDKTHMHHLFVDMGCSHVGTSMRILLLSLIPTAVWLTAGWAGASVDLQFYLVLAAGVLVTCGIYCCFACVRRYMPEKHELRKARLLARRESNREMFGNVRKLMDGKVGRSR